MSESDDADSSMLVDNDDGEDEEDNDNDELDEEDEEEENELEDDVNDEEDEEFGDAETDDDDEELYCDQLQRATKRLFENTDGRQEYVRGSNCNSNAPFTKIPGCG